MADGKIFGSRREHGQVAHTDGTEQTVVELTGDLAIPTTPEGIWYIRADVVCHGSNGTTGLCGQLTGQARMDGGVLSVGNVTWTGTDGGSGYTATLDDGGGVVRVRVTAANLQRSVARIEAFGVEMAITAA